MKNKIDAINKSKLFGVIIECGAGSAISNAIYNVEGASNTILYSLQPYSKTYQHLKYKNAAEYRSVSHEFLWELMLKESSKIRALPECDVNFLLTTSFQIQGSYDDKLTHGWIGFHHIDKDEGGNDRITQFYHVSIPIKYNPFFERKDYFREIANIGINLLYSKIDNEFSFYSEFIDNIITIDGKGEVFSDTYDKLLLLNNIKQLGVSQELMFYIGVTGKVWRFEDLCRNQEGLILVKGSFNPTHHGHLSLLKNAQKLYPNYKAVFFISIGNRDKKELDAAELLIRIQNINLLGYGVVICLQSTFIKNLDWIRERYTIPIIFPVGSDTINRFAKDCIINELNGEGVEDGLINFLNQEIWNDTKFLVFNRKDYKLDESTELFRKIIQIEESYEDDGVSSTKIRNGDLKNKI